MPQGRSHGRHVLIVSGDLPRPDDEKPANPERRGAPRKPIDWDAVAKVTATFEEERQAALAGRTPASGEVRSGNTLPVTGVCHDCGRKVTGERKFCGPCLAKH